MKLAPNGELTIPAEIGRRAGFEPGVEIDVAVEDGELRIFPLNTQAGRSKRLVEALHALAPIQSLLNADEVMALTRGED